MKCSQHQSVASDQIDVAVVDPRMSEFNFHIIRLKNRRKERAVCSRVRGGRLCRVKLRQLRADETCAFVCISILQEGVCVCVCVTLHAFL